MVYADKRSGLRSDAEYVCDPDAAWISPAYKGKVRDPPGCAQVRRGKVNVSAAKPGVTVLSQTARRIRQT
ncbi:hypothetical protein [Bacillus velezensis]|uniref:hypothetical protein n=1 Tax=Bacillus velezensis TaxID=492670 RepID=UPI0023DE95D4|nr:hypothetical protein [Bacillus velezensis]MDF3255653.1 hypothetical protein [Bacillus velezensis]MDF3267117.1 hypothetical protein [Bacillus velezensis]